MTDDDWDDLATAACGLIFMALVFAAVVVVLGNIGFAVAGLIGLAP